MGIEMSSDVELDRNEDEDRVLELERDNSLLREKIEGLAYDVARMGDMLRDRDRAIHNLERELEMTRFDAQRAIEGARRRYSAR